MLLKLFWILRTGASAGRGGIFTILFVRKISIIVCRSCMRILSPNYFFALQVRESLLAAIGLAGPRTRLKEETVQVVHDYKLVIRPPPSDTLFFALQALKQKVQSVRLAGGQLDSMNVFVLHFDAVACRLKTNPFFAD